MKKFFATIFACCLFTVAFSQNNTFDKANKVEIDPGKSLSYKVKVGDSLYYAAKVHGSVGLAYNCSSSDESILKTTRKVFVYDRVPMEGMTGGDAGNNYYVFHALKPGKVKLKSEKNFRGKIEEQITINIKIN